MFYELYSKTCKTVKLNAQRAGSEQAARNLQLMQTLLSERFMIR